MSPMTHADHPSDEELLSRVRAIDAVLDGFSLQTNGSAFELRESLINCIATVRQMVRPLMREYRARQPVEDGWQNGCNETIPAALRFLADNPRPLNGQQRFNAEHLFQLADEADEAFGNNKPSRPSESVRK